MLSKQLSNFQRKLKRTDIPLTPNAETYFLILLISLMTFLLVLSLAGTLILKDMTNRWTSGLENKVTIEILMETDQGYVLSQETIEKETRLLQKVLEKDPYIKSAEILTEPQIRDLISPWIKKDLILDDIPLPGLIAVELKNSNPKILDALRKKIAKASEHARLETHQEWLSDLLSLMTIFKTISLIISLIVMSITITTITAGISIRLALHEKTVDLLHFMGASDTYIAKQFQNHTIIIALTGGLIGTILALTLVFIVQIISFYSASPLIPNLHLGLKWTLTLCLIPFMICALALLTTRIAILHSLLKMP